VLDSTLVFRVLRRDQLLAYGPRIQVRTRLQRRQINAMEELARTEIGMGHTGATAGYVPSLPDP